MSRSTDIRPSAVTGYYLPVVTRVPLKFGPETLSSVVCLRVRMRVEQRDGASAEGWGETPLSVQWVWPSLLPYSERLEALQRFCTILAKAWANFDVYGHPVEVGYDFIEDQLPDLAREFNHSQPDGAALPWLAVLVCCSAFDLALHDAYGRLHQTTVYETLSVQWMSRFLSDFLQPAEDTNISFNHRELGLELVVPASHRLTAWHLVGGKDALELEDLEGTEPDDGYPVTLRQWIQRDGLHCLKVKLRGDDEAWDLERLLRVGRLGAELGVDWLSADFNCTVRDPRYVTGILDQLLRDAPRTYGMLLYVEQPFPYDLEQYPVDVRSVSARKPLFMDESAHDWRMLRLGRSLGWSGVALKTCKTQTGALLSASWARAHGMTLMVQDLTNPMLAQIPHVLLAAHIGTILGVETNSMQFYPDASVAEAAVHPGLYRRRNGGVDWSTVKGPGFGYRLEEIGRVLPPPAFHF